MILTNRETELRLVNLDPRRLEFVQQRERLAEAIAPARMPQFHGDRVLVKRAQQSGHVTARCGRLLEARWKLREYGAQLFSRRQRLDAASELVEIHRVRIGQHP